jgi:hypothetical protein
MREMRIRLFCYYSILVYVIGTGLGSVMKEETRKRERYVRVLESAA